MGDLAAAVSDGARSIPGTEARVRTLAEADIDEVGESDGLVLGSPNWSGMSARMKEWLDQGEDYWEYQLLAGRVGAAFTAARSRSSGNEITLLQLWHVMLANGMICVGLPWSSTMRTSSNSYYGPIAVGPAGPDDLESARVLGRRVAETARRMNLAKEGPL
jgi:NAD(P)H dehydrogenase (quinone)